MKLHRVTPTVAIVMAATFTLAACGGDDAGTGGEDSGGASDAGEGSDSGETLSGRLVGAGASSQESAMTAWIAGYLEVQPEVEVQYDAVGSGAGREQFLAGATDFAGSDAFLDEEERGMVSDACAGGEAVNLPMYISPVAVPYNLPGVDELNLAPEVLAGIMNAEITTWDDEAIAADNPDAELPSTDITVVHRSDESGTTENFMEYLTAAAPDAWPHEPGDAWPVEGGEAAAQTTGVMQVINSTEGTIGYADASAVTGQSASIGVGEEFVAFSPEAAAKVVEASEPADTGIEGDLALDLARDTTESGAYPIVLVSYHIACKEYDDAERADNVKAFLSYVASEEGQQAASDAAGSAPIGESTREQVMESIDMITGG